MRIKHKFKTSLRLFISFRVNSVPMKISCRFEVLFRSKWLIWNPYRSEFHFTSIHVNKSKELAKHRSEIFNRNEIWYWFELISPLMWTYSYLKNDGLSNYDGLWENKKNPGWKSMLRLDKIDSWILIG